MDDGSLKQEIDELVSNMKRQMRRTILCTKLYFDARDAAFVEKIKLHR